MNKYILSSSSNNFPNIKNMHIIYSINFDFSEVGIL